MSVFNARAFLPLCGIISIACMVWAAFTDNKGLSIVAAIAFALAVIVCAISVNLRHARSRIDPQLNVAIEISRVNAIFMALVFVWGALALLGVYGLSGLWWWHSWQYGLLMFALGVVLYMYSRMIDESGHPLRRRVFLDLGAVLALLQGLGAAIGLGFLVGSDKLSSLKSDWPANHVFLAGGIAICVLSLLAAGMYFWMRSRASRT